MHNVTEKSILLRKQIEIPKGIELATEAFHEGWNLARSVDADQLGKTINSSCPGLDPGYSS